ncbi:hypothetical protein C3941_23705 [Kaistia algarum]|uniref:transcription termination/antitermination protein NusG n=1 Tax=Kaistia algarum TaxID=2083279 RepID=UPI000CE93368|nr:transcription termination/antitermination NusG family protein [Kaistia algarum]MCX5513434.1 transcription termination/antitermination NusG family protein [Kaistia algarum]PPE77466.1 hypothetical protein C3941_23705 [Kaistia algarum]
MNAGGWKIGDIVAALPHLAADGPVLEQRWGEAFWYVAHVMTGREVGVADEIKALGFRAYVPMRTRFVRVRRHARRKSAALFRGYVFFEVVPDPRNWTLVRAIDDILGILVVSNGDVPVRVDAEDIGRLMAAEDMKMFDETIGSNAVEFQVGDRVSIAAGGHQGYEGRVERIAGRQAEIIALGPKGRRSIKLPIDLLRILA